MTEGPRLRPALDDIPAYRAGRPAPAGSFKLSSNESSFPPLPSVQAALLDAAGAANRYPDFASSALVGALARRYGVTPEEIAVGTGSVAVADQLVRVTAGPGDEVLFAWRSFEAYPIITRIAGATPVTVPLRPDETHDLPAMAAAMTDRTRLVFVCTPNNPTGAVSTGAELERFLDAVPADTVVALDEAYREFIRRDDVPDGLDLARGRPNVVVLRTFSKAYGLAGLRVGFALGAPRVVEALRKVQTPFGVSTAAEYAAIASLAAEPELLRRVDAVVAERVRMTRALHDAGLSLHPSQANFLWLRLGDAAVEFAAACEQAGVVVRAFPGEGVRVTVGEPEANDRALAVAAAFR